MKKIIFLGLIVLVAGISFLPNSFDVPDAQSFTPGTAPTVNQPTQVGYWKFDEIEWSTVPDETGNGNSGSLIMSPERVNGQFGYGGDFALNNTSNGGYLNVGTLGNFGSQLGDTVTDVSFELWYKPTDTLFSISHLMGSINASGPSMELYRRGNSGSNIPPNNLGFRLTNGTDSIEVLTDAPGTNENPNTQEWHHLVVTASNITTSPVVKFYLNGIEQTDIYSSTLNPFQGDGGNFQDDFYISGANQNGSAINAYATMIDNVIIHSVALDASTVQTHYEQGLPVLDEVTVTATVDPTISFDLETNDCSLGVLSPSTLNSCEVGLTFETNATNGMNIYMENVTSGGFALAHSGSSGGIANVSGYCSDPTYTTQATCEGNAGTWTDNLIAGVEGGGWGVDVEGTPSGLQSVSCSNPLYHTQTTCTNGGGTWAQSYCSGLTAPECNGIGGLDAGGSCLYVDKTSCEAGNGTWVSTCTGGGTNGNATLIGTTPFDVVGASVGHDTFALFAGFGATVTANLCFTASVDDLTPAGVYTGLYELTGVGNF